jgi:hypothetical protein
MPTYTRLIKTYKGYLYTLVYTFASPWSRVGRSSKLEVRNIPKKIILLSTSLVSSKVLTKVLFNIRSLSSCYRLFNLIDY